MKRFLLILSLLATLPACAQMSEWWSVAAQKPAAAGGGGCSSNILVSQTTATSVTAVNTTGWKSQGFKFTVSTTIIGFWIKLQDINNDAGSVVLSIFTDNAGCPTDLSSGGQIADTESTVACAAITNDGAGEFVWFALPQNFSATANTTYHIMVHSIDSANVNLFYNEGSVYADGGYCYTFASGNSWSPYTADFGFKIVGCQ